MDGHDESLNLFFDKPVNHAFIKTQFIEHLPISQFGSNCIEFNVSSQNYLDLSRSQLFLKCKVVSEDNTALENIANLEGYKVGGDVCPSNLLFASMFSKVDLNIQHQNISSEIPSLCYSYKHYIDNLLSTTSDENLAIMFAKDPSKAMYANSLWKASHPDNSVEGGNPALKKRQKLIDSSQSFEMIGDIALDFMRQRRLLLHNTNVGLKFWRSSPEFALLSPITSPKFNVKILDAKLILCHVTLQPTVSLAIAESLELKPAQYHFEDSKIRTHTISKGSQSATLNELFGASKSPDKLYVCLIKSKAFLGDFLENPYFMQHANLSEIGFYLNNISLPGKPLQLNFDDSAYKSHFVEAWQRLNEQNPNNIVNFEDFHRGYTLFCFDLTNKEHFSELEPNTPEGSTKLELRFSKPLENSIVVVLYGKFKSLLTIDSARNVILQ